MTSDEPRPDQAGDPVPPPGTQAEVPVPPPGFAAAPSPAFAAAPSPPEAPEVPEAPAAPFAPVSAGLPQPPQAPADATAPPPEPPGPPAPGGAYPVGPYPVGTTVLGTPAEPITLKAEPRRRRGLIAGIAAAVIALGALAVKFVIPLVLVTAVGGAIGTVFGGPFEKLPADQKQALEQRFDAAVGDSLKNLSDAETTAKVDAMLTAGLPRLADQELVDKVHLTAKLLNTADVATCATIARATATGKGDTPALTTALNALDTPSMGRWFEINVAAIEAQAKGTPPARTVDKAESDRVLGDVFARFSDVESQQIGSLYNGAEASDADACNAFRALYTHIEALPAADLAIAALYDVSP